MSAQPDFGPKGWTPDHLASQEGRTFVITGANTGAGFQASRLLLAKGAVVVMLNRLQQSCGLYQKSKHR